MVDGLTVSARPKNILLTLIRECNKGLTTIFAILLRNIRDRDDDVLLLWFSERHTTNPILGGMILAHERLNDGHGK